MVDPPFRAGPLFGLSNRARVPSWDFDGRSAIQAKSIIGKSCSVSFSAGKFMEWVDKSHLLQIFEGIRTELAEKSKGFSYSAVGKAKEPDTLYNSDPKVNS
jgi:hypothetical protein